MMHLFSGNAGGKRCRPVDCYWEKANRVPVDNVGATFCP
jgi:hypothetical protein